MRFLVRGRVKLSKILESLLTRPKLVMRFREVIRLEHCRVFGEPFGTWTWR